MFSFVTSQFGYVTLLTKTTKQLNIVVKLSFKSILSTNKDNRMDRLR